MKVGWDIIDWPLLTRIHRIRREHLFVMALTLGLTVFVDLVTAVAIGLIAAGMVHARQLEGLELDSVVSVPLLDHVFFAGHEEADRMDRYAARVGLVQLDRVAGGVNPAPHPPTRRACALPIPIDSAIHIAASGAVDIATHASVSPTAAKSPSIPAPAASPNRYRKTSTTGLALYFSAGNCSVRPWRGVLSGGSREGGAQRLRVRLQRLASGQSQISLVGLPYCLAVS